MYFVLFSLLANSLPPTVPHPREYTFNSRKRGPPEGQVGTATTQQHSAPEQTRLAQPPCPICPIQQIVHYNHVYMYIRIRDMFLFNRSSIHTFSVKKVGRGMITAESECTTCSTYVHTHQHVCDISLSQFCGTLAVTTAMNCFYHTPSV